MMDDRLNDGYMSTLMAEPKQESLGNQEESDEITRSCLIEKKSDKYKGNDVVLGQEEEEGLLMDQMLSSQKEQEIEKLGDAVAGFQGHPNSLSYISTAMIASLEQDPLYNNVDGNGNYIDTSKLHLLAEVYDVFGPGNALAQSKEKSKVVKKKSKNVVMLNKKESNHLWGFRNEEEKRRPHRCVQNEIWLQCDQCFVWRCMEDTELAKQNDKATIPTFSWNCSMYRNGQRHCGEACDYCQHIPCKCQSNSPIKHYIIHKYHLPVGFWVELRFRTSQDVIGDPWLKFAAYCKTCDKLNSSMDRREKLISFLETHQKHNTQWQLLKQDHFDFRLDDYTRKIYRFYEQKNGDGLFPLGLDAYLDQVKEEEIGKEAWVYLKDLQSLFQQQIKRGHGGFHNYSKNTTEKKKKKSILKKDTKITNKLEMEKSSNKRTLYDKKAKKSTTEDSTGKGGAFMLSSTAALKHGITSSSLEDNGLGHTSKKPRTSDTEKSIETRTQIIEKDNKVQSPGAIPSTNVDTRNASPKSTKNDNNNENEHINENDYMPNHHYNQNIINREIPNNYYPECDLTLCDPYLSYYLPNPNHHHQYMKNITNFKTRGGFVTELLQDEKIIPKLKDLKIKNMLYTSYMYGNPSLDVYDPEEVEKCQLLSLTSSTTTLPSILSDDDDHNLKQT